MEGRKYSITDIQRIAKLSPSALQDILKKYQKYIYLETSLGPDGKNEVFIDQSSFEKLLFFKQLEFGQELNCEEILNQIKVPSVRDLQYDADGRNTVKSLGESLDILLQEMQSLHAAFRNLVIRYNQITKELDESRTENFNMKREIDFLKVRQKTLLEKTTPDDDLSEISPEEKIN